MLSVELPHDLPPRRRVGVRRSLFHPLFPCTAGRGRDRFLDFMFESIELGILGIPRAAIVSLIDQRNGLSRNTGREAMAVTRRNIVFGSGLKDATKHLLPRVTRRRRRFHVKKSFGLSTVTVPVGKLKVEERARKARRRGSVKEGDEDGNVVGV